LTFNRKKGKIKWKEVFLIKKGQNGSFCIIGNNCNTYFNIWTSTLRDSYRLLLYVHLLHGLPNVFTGVKLTYKQIDQIEIVED